MASSDDQRILNFTEIHPPPKPPQKQTKKQNKKDKKQTNKDCNNSFTLGVQH